MLQHRDCKLSEQNNTMLRSWFASTFFFAKLLNDENDRYEYNNVRKWTRKIDIFSADKVLIPINLTNTHWTMLVFYMLLKEIHYYDSMSGNGDRYINYGLRWLADEIMDKKGIAIDINEWTQFQQEVHVPQQHNGYDCGMFVLMCARAIAYNQPFSSYHQRDVPRYRSMIGRHILQGSLLDFIDQSVPYMFQLTPEHQTAQPHQAATLSLNVGTSLRRKTNISSQRPLMFTHVQPQSQYSTKSTAAAAAIAAAAFEEEDSVDSEESNDYEQKFEGTKYNPQNHVHVHISKNSSTKSAPAIGEEEQSVDSEEDADNKPTEGTNIGSAIFAQEYGTKALSVTKTKHFDETEENSNSNSDTEGSSETCESETKFGVDAEASSKRKRKGKSKEALARNNTARRNSYMIKNEQRRKSNKNYNTALLGLNDSDLTSMPTDTDHQVR
jgi:hypothetical protein